MNNKQITKKQFWVSIGLKMLITFLIALCMFMVFLYSRQEKMIFYPQPISQRELSEIIRRYQNVEDIKIKSKDGTIIRGWLLKTPHSTISPLVMYFGGNAEEVSYLIGEFDKFSGWSLALMNYRGYGLSEGKPGEKALFDDALASYDYFVKRGDVDNKSIIAMGRSLGSGVAVYLAQQRPVKGLILVTPFDSIKSVAQEKFPFLPVSLLLKHPFDSVSRAPSIKAPLLALAAKDDTIFPLHHVQRLVDSWGGPYTLKILEGVDHNTIDLNPQYWPSVEDFLSKHKPL
jgi:uncharacterized protein